ncbi:hypothetical protein C6501_03385 [Candidatus Poribacteria bacterium]|nr:MAG: hypothetical protein C6501_03385 [Candidatus Poribacteria bacterium]
MFRRNFTTIAIAAVIASLLLIGVNNSNAASITSLSVSATTDYGAGASISASLSADEDIQFIDWWIKQTYPKPKKDDRDYKKLFTSSPYGGTSISVALGSFDGHIKIAEYSVKAVVWFSDAENNTFISDTSTTSTSVYKPDVDSGTKKTGIYGLSELTSHHFDGSYIVMCGYVYAYNYLGKFANGSGRFRHTEAERGLRLEQDLPGARFKTTYSHCTSDYGMFFSTGGAIQEGEPWECSTYLRLVVDGDNWFAGGSNRFTDEDNR